MAGPLRGGMKEKRTFFGTFYLFCCLLKIKDISINTTYQNINTAVCQCWQSCSLYQICCHIWQKKYGSFSPKIVQREKVVKISFHLI